MPPLASYARAQSPPASNPKAVSVTRAERALCGHRWPMSANLHFTDKIDKKCREEAPFCWPSADESGSQSVRLVNQRPRDYRRYSATPNVPTRLQRRGRRMRHRRSRNVRAAPTQIPCRVDHPCEGTVRQIVRGESLARVLRHNDAEEAVESTLNRSPAHNGQSCADYDLQLRALGNDVRATRRMQRLRPSAAFTAECAPRSHAPRRE